MTRSHGIGYQSSDGSHWFNGSVSVKDQTANGDCLLIMSLLYNIFFIYLPLFFDDFVLLDDENAESLKC